MKTIDEVHCQQCGSTRPEDVGYDALRLGDGYTQCCNERAIYPQDIDNGLNFYTGKRLTKPWRCDPTDCSHE